MEQGLAALSKHINRELARQIHPLFLVVDESLQLIESRGNAERYGLPGLHPGHSLAEPLAMLATADPSDTTPQQWSFVELPTGAICHVHVLRLSRSWGVVLLDASEEHAAQQSRQQAAHELLLLRDERDQLIEELERANRMKGEFIARMSHEFRTPLASVIGYSDELRELKADDREVQYHLGAVGRGGRYLLNLIENLLDHARIEVGELNINPSGCDLHVLSDEVEQLLRPVAQKKNLSLAWFFDADTPQRIWGDATRLKQVLINLVGNAIKFTKTGSVNVEFSWTDDRLQVAVEDTGPGIAKADAETIFEAFRQAGDTQAKGAGLGLAISQTLVRAMGGDIRLSSEEGRGSRFEFDISAPFVRSGRTEQSTSLAYKQILIADDDPDIGSLLQRYLASSNCAVSLTSNAAETLIAAAQKKPDIVLLDLNLGADDGHAVARQLRANGYRKLIVALSAEDPMAEQTGESPFDARWNKPISRQQLVDGLSALLQQS